MSKLAVGDRVRLIGSHPWAGHTGTVVRLAPAGLAGPGLYPVVRLDAGDDVPDRHECYVMRAAHARRLSA